MTVTECEIIDRFRVALAAATTLKKIDACLDRAWELLPFDAAEANTIVIQELARRREEIRND